MKIKHNENEQIGVGLSRINTCLLVSSYGCFCCSLRLVYASVMCCRHVALSSLFVVTSDLQFVAASSKLS